MGMNYYYTVNVCEHCGRSDVLHVGKKSSGWTFHFRAYRIDTGAKYDITSVADWAKMFKNIPGIFSDENEHIIALPLNFLAELEHPTPFQIVSEDSPERRGHWSPRPDPATEWRDEEGFAFYDGVFS